MHINFLNEALEEVLLNESVSDIVDKVIHAIKNHKRVIVRYKSAGQDKIGIKPRLIEVYAYGFTKRGNPVIRAFQPVGDSYSQRVPEWKFMRLDRIISWEETDETFNSPPTDYTNIGDFNPNDDLTMATKPFIIAQFNNPPEGYLKAMQGPVTKDDVRMPNMNRGKKEDDTFKSPSEKRAERTRRIGVIQGGKRVNIDDLDDKRMPPKDNYTDDYDDEPEDMTNDAFGNMEYDNVSEPGPKTKNNTYNIVGGYNDNNSNSQNYYYTDYSNPNTSYSWYNPEDSYTSTMLPNGKIYYDTPNGYRDKESIIKQKQTQNNKQKEPINKPIKQTKRDPNLYIPPGEKSVNDLLQKVRNGLPKIDSLKENTTKPKGRFSYNMGYRVSPTKVIKIQVSDNYEFVRYQINNEKPSKWIEFQFGKYDENDDNGDLERYFIANDGNKYFLDDFEVIWNPNEYN